MMLQGIQKVLYVKCVLNAALFKLSKVHTIYKSFWTQIAVNFKLKVSSSKDEYSCITIQIDVCRINYETQLI